MMKKMTLITAVMAGCFYAVAALAAASDPVEITAQKSLEWNRAKQTYTARGEAQAKQGALSVASDVLTAAYDSKGGGTNITTLTAEGNVKVTSNGYSATGDKAVYTVATGHAVLTGEKVQMTTPDTVVTAKNDIVFDRDNNSLTAEGGAVATRGADRLNAESMTAFFKNTEGSGALTLDHITAKGGVTIKTAKETITGSSALYDLTAKKAGMEGPVKVIQGENTLEGTRAEIDLTTGISRLFGGATTPAGGGRVKGVFYPTKKQ